MSTVNALVVLSHKNNTNTPTPPPQLSSYQHQCLGYPTARTPTILLKSKNRIATTTTTNTPTLANLRGRGTQTGAARPTLGARLRSTTYRPTPQLAYKIGQQCVAPSWNKSYCRYRIFGRENILFHVYTYVYCAFGRRKLFEALGVRHQCQRRPSTEQPVPDVRTLRRSSVPRWNNAMEP